MREIKDVNKTWITKEKALEIIRSIMGNSEYVIKYAYPGIARWYIEIYYTDYKTECQISKLINEAFPGCQLDLERNISNEALKRITWEYFEGHKVFSTFDVHDRPVKLNMADVFYAVAGKIDLSEK